MDKRALATNVPRKVYIIKEVGINEETFYEIIPSLDKVEDLLVQTKVGRIRGVERRTISKVPKGMKNILKENFMPSKGIGTKNGPFNVQGLFRFRKAVSLEERDEERGEGVEIVIVFVRSCHRTTFLRPTSIICPISNTPYVDSVNTNSQTVFNVRLHL